MEPVYRNIEFCSRPDAAWAKLRSGRYDWLGVRNDGNFVLGSPPASRLTGTMSATLIKGGATEGVHGVRLVSEPGREAHPSVDWFATAQEARDQFDKLVAEWEAREGPMLARIELVVDGKVERAPAERPPAYVINLQPTYGVWRAPPPE